MEHRWTIHELAAALELAIRLAPQNGQASGRVREVPDQRTIRYYNTLGMVDRPELVGRTAYYNERHLWQLLAIKRLQARGEALVQVQTKLAGASDTQLKRLAALPEGFWQTHAKEREAGQPAREAAQQATAAPRAAEPPPAAEPPRAAEPPPAAEPPRAAEPPPAAEAPERKAAFWQAEPSATSAPGVPADSVALCAMAAPAASIEATIESPAGTLALRPAVHVALTDEMTLVLEGAASVQFAHLSPTGRQRLAELAREIAEVLASEHPAGHEVHLVHQPRPQGNADSGASSV